jgi:hypothetical protein
VNAFRAEMGSVKGGWWDSIAGTALLLEETVTYFLGLEREARRDLLAAAAEDLPGLSLSQAKCMALADAIFVGLTRRGPYNCSRCSVARA